MSIPEPIKPYYAQDRVERAESAFASKATVTQLDINQVMIISQVEAGIDKYRFDADAMKQKDLRDEEHQSQRLAAHLEEIGDSKPHDNCHAHAIISGAHRNAAPMRAIMARQKLRIDDPYNGCWLPASTAALPFMPTRLKNAVPHSRIHRFNYYFWLGSQISLTKTPTADDLKYTLKTIGLQLQAGAQPPFVMLKKGEGIEE